jgi:hypothetical protein
MQDLKGIGCGVIEIFFRHFSEGAEKSKKKFQPKLYSNQALPE